MLPQFGQIVTVSVMAILVALFTWIYVRERQQRVALWMLGWIAIVIHFSFELAQSFSLLPSHATDWVAYVSLMGAAVCFLLSVCTFCSTIARRLVLLLGLLAPSVAYWTCEVFEVRATAIFPILLVLFGSSAVALAILDKNGGRPSSWWLLALAPFGAVTYVAGDHPEYGMDLILCAAFWATAFSWWRHYRQVRPGVVLTAVSFVAWGAVFPLGEALAHFGIAIPGDHVVWDLPKYFVAFGMIVTLFEKQTEALQREVAERKRAEEAARSADEAKSLYLAAVSHEIRTPLNGIIGLTSILTDSSLTAEQRLDLSLVKSSAESLLMVVNDILDFSKIEAGKFVFEAIQFNLHAQIAEVLQGAAIRAHQKGLELVSDISESVPEQVLGDPVRLRQILVNLLSNAVKFTLEGEVVLTVDAERDGEDAARLHFQVRDTGIGVPADKRESIFEAFRQADESIARRFGGTGLGLTISARLADMMDGRTWMDDAPDGQGSVFHCTIRVGAASIGVEPDREPLPENRRRFPALLIDDNATSRRILSERLAKWGLHTETAPSGEAALALIAARRDAGHPFGVILVDSQMPGLDGFETVEQMRLKLGLTGPILMLVPAASSADLARTKNCRIDGVIQKPVQTAEMYKALARLPERTSSREPARSRRVAAAGGAPLRILLAEDNALNRLVAVRLLEREGYRVSVVMDGREAVEAFQRESFDVILMDVQMPEMDGLEATVAIRQAERATGGHIPIIAATAHAMKGDEQLCLEAGMDAYLSKPLDIARLLELIVSLTEAWPQANGLELDRSDRAARASAGSTPS